MLRSGFRKLAVAAPLALVPGLALAHPGVGAAHGFTHGFVHPVSGIDHVLAMVLVGIFAAQLGGRAIFLLPAAFIALMTVGGGLGMAGIGLPFVELGIALSVIGLGAVVALNVKAPVALAMGVVGLFALFHGHAHGAEMPESAGGLAYAAGFLVATAMLHAAGIAAGFGINALSQRRGPAVVRLAGGIAAVAGVGLLAGLV